MDKERGCWTRISVTVVITTLAILATFVRYSPSSYAKPYSITQHSGISGAEIIARAKSWVDVNSLIPYNQRGYYQGYREDCSGFVSMAWQLMVNQQPDSLSTYTLPSVSHPINKDDLQPGDILLNQWGGWPVGTYGSPDAHVVIFDSWVDKSHTHYNAYEENPFWGGVHHTTNIPYPFWPGYDSSHYVPMRFNSLSNSPAPTTVPMPPTQTSCPSVGTGRVAITRPLLLGQDQNVVYIDNEPTSGSLERYDVKKGSTTEIFSAASQSIYEAQVSTDGQWIFFVVEGNGRAAFQMIRMDGQGLQTLYCTQSQDLSDVQWSPDQASIAFSVIGTGTGLPETTISFLDLKMGQFRTLSTSQGPLSGCCVFLHWLDASHLAVIGSQGIRDIPDDGNLLLLDTSQTGGNLKSIFQPTVPADTTDSTGQPCYDFITSTDQTQLFFSQCSLTRYYPMSSDAVVAQGPGSINVEPLTGGSSQTIYSNPKLAITAIQTISQTQLLFYVCNFSSQQGQSVDTSQNGLWTINTDGSGLRHLTTATVEEPYYFFFGVPQPTWLVISRDGSMYASSRSDTSSVNQSLFVGSLNGGNPATFLSRQFTYTSSGLLDGNINVVGWTNM
jgi:hypothetical protein